MLYEYHTTALVPYGMLRVACATGFHSYYRHLRQLDAEWSWLLRAHIHPSTRVRRMLCTVTMPSWHVFRRTSRLGLCSREPLRSQVEWSNLQQVMGHERNGIRPLRKEYGTLFQDAGSPLQNEVRSQEQNRFLCWTSCRCAAAWASGWPPCVLATWHQTGSGWQGAPAQACMPPARHPQPPLTSHSAGGLRADGALDPFHTGFHTDAEHATCGRPSHAA